MSLDLTNIIWKKNDIYMIFIYMIFLGKCSGEPEALADEGVYPNKTFG